MSLHIVDFLRHAIIHYGYWAVGAVLLLENIGLPLPGETILLLASFLAYSEHDLQLPWIVIVATAVTTIGGSLGFAVGQYGGRALLGRYQLAFRIPQTTLARGENLFARFGAVTVFFARFVFGIRIVAGPLAGVLRMPWGKFLLWNFLGATAWVTAVTTVGYSFGRHWGRLERDMKRFDIGVVIVLGLLAAAWWWRSRRQNGTVHPL
ncbi:MAG TPA: DedA family protein [Terriglobales bacterium]|nr:DedA family protein [Terriglobales bacterium]